MRILTPRLALPLLLLLLSACQNLQQTESPTGIADASAAPVIDESIARKEQLPKDSILANIPNTENLGNEKSYDDLWKRIREGFQLQAHYTHPDVTRYIQSYANQQHYFDLLQARAAPFLFEIVEEIERRGLPMEFALLPMVESTYNPNAYSREHAVGLWQFVGATGKSFGLQQDWWFDGRRDPLASTTAALDYMEQLHKQFDEDWLLAIAAYNTGDGNLRRAIRRSGETEVNFWDLNLPGETEAHVPKLLALSAIIAKTQQWDIELKSLPNEAVLRSVSVGTQIDISQAARLAGMEYDQLRTLNPGYLQWATHPDQPQKLLLPIENADILENALTGIDARDLLTWDRYEIQPGDTLGAIAVRLNTRVDILQTFNSLSDSRIVAGDSLLIPRSSDPDLLASAPRVERNRPRQRVAPPAKYTVRNGDNLWRIARRFDLRSKEIAAWNQISLDELLQPGQILDLSYTQHDKNNEVVEQISSGANHYIVRRGDNMDAIARRFGIDLEKLLLWNALNGDELIFPGQELQVVPDSSGN